MDTKEETLTKYFKVRYYLPQGGPDKNRCISETIRHSEKPFQQVRPGTFASVLRLRQTTGMMSIRVMALLSVGTSEHILKQWGKYYFTERRYFPYRLKCKLCLL
jgi:hypothetical protein